MAPEELAERAAAAAPRLTEAQRAMIAAALGPSVSAAARRQRLHHDLKRRRRVSGELDQLCGVDRLAS